MHKQRFLLAVFLLTICLFLAPAERDFAQAPLASDGPSNFSITTEKLSVLTGKDWDARRAATEALRKEHRKLVDALIKIVEESEEEKLPEARAYAANLLGEWHAVSAIPVLMKHLDYEVITSRTDVREFHLETYPCATAIAEMGPTALKPTLAELAKRKTGLKDKEVPIAAYLIVELCEDSKQAAIDAILMAEYKFDNSLALVRTRTYIENSMGQMKSTPRRRPARESAP